MPGNWRDVEGGVITAVALDQFLRENRAGGGGVGADGGAAPETWAEVDGDAVFPAEDASVHVWITRARGGFDWQRLAELARAGLPASYENVPELAHLLTGLEAARKADFEEWLAAEGLEGPAYTDDRLLSLASAYEQATRRR